MTKHFLTIFFISLFAIASINAQDFLSDSDYSVSVQTNENIQYLEVKLNVSGVTSILLYKGFPDVVLLNTIKVEESVINTPLLSNGFYTVVLKDEDGITVGMRSIEIKE